MSTTFRLLKSEAASIVRNAIAAGAISHGTPSPKKSRVTENNTKTRFKKKPVDKQQQ